ncbi:MAG: hypothetical protein J6386_01175 [Candidatus Synoicihabitans palmerolidicus]|nr:hypothetical protein [Candidatus Synoicihabitans palmerolidicus]
MVILRGTSVHALLQGVLLDPLRHPSHIIIGLKSPGGFWLGASVVLTVVVRAGWELRRHGTLSRITTITLVSLRFSVIAVMLIHCQS